MKPRFFSQRIQIPDEPDTFHESPLNGVTGMGLAISKRLIDMMNGTLTVRSVAGEGSEFLFEIILPLAKRSNA